MLSYVPDVRAFGLAQDLARGRALCVVEGSLLPLSAWAAETGAVWTSPDLDRLLSTTWTPSCGLR